MAGIGRKRTLGPMSEMGGKLTLGRRLQRERVVEQTTEDLLDRSQTGVVVINVFTVAPEDQEQLIDLLTQVTECFVKNVDGFLSATLHRSTDGTKVAMYARWRSAQDYQ